MLTYPLLPTPPPAPEDKVRLPPLAVVAEPYPEEADIETSAPD